MTIAKNREEFIRVWKSELNQLGCLYPSLPQNKIPELTRIIKELEELIEVASKEAFPEK